MKLIVMHHFSFPCDKKFSASENLFRNTPKSFLSTVQYVIVMPRKDPSSSFMSLRSPDYVGEDSMSEAV